jgi:hypothetical protein
MAKDPSKKGVRKIPKEFLDWIENTYNKETAAWYKTNAGRSKAWASKDRINLSEEVGKVGAYHEGHFQGAKDFDLKTGMGGGPTTGRTMRSEIGVLNVAHAEKPRIPKAEMRRLGIPQYWLEDFYEALLEAENLKVIGNLDRQAALDIDAGMPVEQAAAQSRMRDDLRRQEVKISGSRPTYQTKPAPLPQNITQQAIPPEFDVSEIKVTGEVRVRPRTSRIPKVPQNPVEFVEGIKFNGGKANFFGGVPFAQEIMETVRTNPLGAGMGALTVVDPESVKLVRQGQYGQAGIQTGTGAVVGAVAEQLGKMAVKLVPEAGKMVLKPVVGAVAAPLAAGMAGYQALDVITTAATGKTLAETGQAAEETKEELRQQGVSEYQLRRKARTGRY